MQREPRAVAWLDAAARGTFLTTATVIVARILWQLLTGR